MFCVGSLLGTSLAGDNLASQIEQVMRHARREPRVAVLVGLGDDFQSGMLHKFGSAFVI
jgi:hypothetical protein